MHEDELWLTAWFNNHLAGAANSILGLVHMTAQDPARPWENWIVMELLVVAIMMAGAALLRPRLSVEKPGKFQHVMEAFYGFFKNTMEDVGIEHGGKYLGYFGTVFLFILVMNLIGLIPGLESPTMFPAVPLGLALVTFLFYNALGFGHHGPKYLLQFVGPIWWLAPLMIPIEFASHLARPMSLTIRLYANMFAGERVTTTFMSLIHLLVPVLFMGLHVFVAFLQAYIFMILSMIYVKGAISHDH
ncbi:MAG TPA: F0F1 ATP synthase subunit A [Bryobacteraceae bacterium]|nr:F0F1 ATP synthase subunit A [Bryobacteraceae bacterium]